MESAKIFRINYKSDFILTLVSDAGWMTPFCIKFWTGAPSQAYYVQWDGETYTHCAPVEGEPTKLQVQFDDHHLPIGNLKYQVAYHFTVADFPNDTEDEVLNQANITTEIDGQEYQVMLDFTGETAPEIQFSLPAYANEAQRIENEQQRIANEEQRIADEQTRIDNEALRISAEQTRQNNEDQRIRNEQTRISQEEARVREFATLKQESEAATTAANNAAALANQKAQLAADKAQLAADKAALAQDAANLANQKAQLAADKAALAQDAADLANQKAQLAQQKAEYAQTQGDYAKQQGDYAKEQGDYAKRKGDDAATQMQQQAQAFSEAQAAHQTAYQQAEGTESGSVAGDGSRWGAFKTNEAARDAKVDAKVADITNLQEAVAEGAVYDVSAQNPTAGPNNDGKWGSLSALLSDANLNTLIPTSVRRGGMSIKFVCSSDNNYMQYMYRGTDVTTVDTFTNVINWEKVNLEKEVDGLASVKVAISSGKNLFDKASCKIGYAITASGRIVEVSGAGITPLIKISAETQYCYSYQAGSNAFHGYYGIYYDEKLNVLAIQSPAYTFTTPQNAVYLIATFGISHINDIQLETGSARTTYESFNPIMGYLSASLSPINSAIATINTKLSTDEEQIANNTDNIGYIPFTLEQGSLNPSNGALSDDATRVRTKYIVGKFSIRTNSGYYINRICEYNKTTNAFIQTLFNDNTNRITSYNYTGTQEIKLVFSKQNILHNILPTEDIIKDAIYDGSLADRVGKIEGETILPTSYDTFNLENEKVQGFMSSQAYDDNDYSYTNVLSFVSGNVALKLDTPSPVRLTWPKSSDVLRTLVTVIENGVGTRLSSKAVTYEVTSGNNYLEIYNLVPGKTYLYGVYSYTPTGIKTILESSFTTSGQVRMIKVDRVSNVRDIGGWPAESNKKIKYGLLYRGSEFNPSSKGSINLLDAETKEMMRKVLGIKAEIDLRGGFSNLYNTRNGLSEAASLLGADIDYTKYNYVSYDSAITSGTTINSIISSLISNLQNNKPTYLHCAGGCDRTGTVIALIMGACGVSESDIAKEYELTSFSPDIRTRNSETYNYAGMIEAIKTYSGSTFQEKVVSFLTTDGNISESDIATLKSLLLE